jgi:hypothetical protein
LSSAGARFGCLELPSHNQAPANGLIDSLDLQLRRDRALNDHVDERPESSGHPNAVHGFDIALRQARPMEMEHLRNGGHPLKSWRDCHVQLRRHRIGQFVKREGRGVTEGPLRLTASVV